MAWVRNRGTGRKKRWEIHYVNEFGKETQEACSQTTKDDAQDYADELEAKAERIRRGVARHEVPLITLREVCFGTFADSRLRSISHGYFKDVLPGKSLPEARQSEIERHILEHIGDRLIGQLLPVEVDRWTTMLQNTPRGSYERAPQKKLAGKPLSAKSVINVRAHLSAIYRYLRKKLKIPVENPVTDAEQIEKPEPNPKPVDLDHLGPLLANIPTDRRTMFATAVCIGPRKGELAGLLCGDVDLARRIIHIRRSYDHSTTKTKRSRIVAIPKFLIPALRAQLEGRAPEALLFPEFAKGKDGRVVERMMHPKKDLVRILRSALKKARIIGGYEYTCRKGWSVGRGGKAKGRTPVVWGCGLKLSKPINEKTMCPKCSTAEHERKMWVEAKPVNYTFKDLRATFATYALETSGDLDFVQRQMGHEEGSNVTRAHYAKMRAQRMVAHADRLPFADLLPGDMVQDGEPLPFEEGPAISDIGSQLAGPGNNPVARATNLYQAGSRQVSGDKEKHDKVMRDEKASVRFGSARPTVQLPRTPRAKPTDSAKDFAGPTTRVTASPSAFGSQLAGAGRNAVMSGGKRRFRVVDGEADRLYTVKQVAQHLALSTATVYAMVERGELEASRFASQIRIPHSALNAFLERSAVPKGGKS